MPSTQTGAPAYPGLKYGARVYTEPNTSGGLDVHCQVYIGDNDYLDDIGVIGTVGTWQQAITGYNVIRWTPTQLLIGNGSPSDYAVPRARLQTHR